MTREHESRSALSVADRAEAARLRQEFFRRTRLLVIIFYAGMLAAGVAGVIYAASRSPLVAAVGVIAGFALALVLFRLGVRKPVPARSARVWLGIGPALGAATGVALANDVSVHVAGFALGGGFFLGAVVGIVDVRRQLVWDDELLLRQKRLGYDPERPFSWMKTPKDHGQD